MAVVLPHREGFAPGHAGAVAHVVRRLVTGGSRYDARVFGPRFPAPPFLGTDYHPVDTPGWLPLSATHAYGLAVARALARLPPAPIEVHNKPDIATLLARLFPRRPVTLFLHNDPRTMRGARTPAARARLLSRLAATVTVSAYIRDALLDGVPTPARTPLILPNSIAPDELPTPLPMAERDRLILFAGRVVPDKAPDAFIAACALALPRLPGWRAAVIGADGFSEGRMNTPFIASLRPAAAAAAIPLLGYQPLPDTLAAMSRAAIVVVPSRWPEPFGLTALEALACGAALAYAPRGGLPEIAGPAAIPINPDDIPAFAETLITLANDEPRRTQLSAAGQERARALFNTRQIVQTLDQLRDTTVRI